MKLLYFAWLRQRIGHGEEIVELPEHINTVAQLIEWLKGRDETYRSAFSDLRIVRAAINQTLVPLEASLEDAREVAFFPPVTGG